jgi:vancomycin resistance protein VanJ
MSSLPRWRWPSVAVAACTWLYVAVVLIIWLLLWLGGDRWWFATVLLFGPRWPYAIPWIVLAPVVAKVRPRLIWPMTAAALVLIWPIMGLCLPWARLFTLEAPTVRILTCNVDGTAVDATRLAALVADARPDLVALQEWTENAGLIWPEGWHIVHAGQLLVASPYPLDNVESAQRRHPPSPWPPVNALRCTVRTPWGPVRFCCVHLLTPRWGISSVLDRQTFVSQSRSGDLSGVIADRRLESEELVEWLNALPETRIVAGDFNMPTDSAIYRAQWGRFVNAFSTSGLGFGSTKWTPVGGWQFGLRIDHILGGADATPGHCWVGPDVGSDHLPLLADISLPLVGSEALDRD